MDFYLFVQRIPNMMEERREKKTKLLHDNDIYHYMLRGRQTHLKRILFMYTMYTYLRIQKHWKDRADVCSTTNKYTIDSNQ